jgi:predicted dehydrogenase
MLRIGIVGLRRGSSYFSFDVVPGAKVTAICDLDRELLEQCGDGHAIPGHFTRYEEMLESGVDAVVVATPVPLHARQVIQALDAGVHVLSEVPAVATMEECYALAEAVEQSDRKYMMAENYCYIKENVLLKKLAAAGKFGELYFGEGEYVHDCKDILYNPDGSLTWRGRWALERDGNVYPTHSVGPLYQIFGERVASVCCLGSGVHTIPGMKLEDSTLTICKTESGKLLKLRFDMVSNRPHNLRYYSLQGTRGCYEAPRGLGDDHKVWFADDCKEYEWRPLKDYEDLFLPEEWRRPPENALKTGHWGSDYFVLRDFVESVARDERPPIDVYDALNMTATGIASEESIAKGGVPVIVPDFRANVRL